MPNTVILPAAARENMALQAAIQVAGHAPHVAPDPGVNIITSTSANETLVGTDGPDLFVFDMLSPQGSDVIVGYDVAEDRIEFRTNATDAVALGVDTETSGQTTIFFGSGQVTVDADWVTLLNSDTVSQVYSGGEIIF